MPAKKRSKKGRATGVGILIGARWSMQEVAAIDAFRAGEVDKPRRAGALRRLVKIGLDATKGPLRK
jgi:hypothetical protein